MNSHGTIPRGFLCLLAWAMLGCVELAPIDRVLKSIKRNLRPIEVTSLDPQEWTSTNNGHQIVLEDIIGPKGIENLLSPVDKALDNDSKVKPDTITQVSFNTRDHNSLHPTVSRSERDRLMLHDWVSFRNKFFESQETDPDNFGYLLPDTLNIPEWFIADAPKIKKGENKVDHVFASKEKEAESGGEVRHTMRKLMLAQEPSEVKNPETTNPSTKIANRMEEFKKINILTNEVYHLQHELEKMKEEFSLAGNENNDPFDDEHWPTMDQDEEPLNVEGQQSPQTPNMNHDVVYVKPKATITQHYTDEQNLLLTVTLPSFIGMLAFVLCVKYWTRPRSSLWRLCAEKPHEEAPSCANAPLAPKYSIIEPSTYNTAYSTRVASLRSMVYEC